MAELFPTALPPAVEGRPRVGDYFRTEHDLYRVEEIHGDFAQIEDCKTEIVLEVALEEILAMTPVRRSTGSD